MATETETASPPAYTSLCRVASIPLIASPLDSIHSTLSKNPYLASPYHTVQTLAQTAWGYSVPIQTRLAPITTRADGFANAGLDAVESRYPYPFKAKPQEIIDQKVISPVCDAARNIDKQIGSPIVNFLEVQVNKSSPENTGPSSPTKDTKYQYQRAFELSKDLTENVCVLSNKHLKQLEADYVIVKLTTNSAQTITNLAQSSLTNTQILIHDLSKTMLQQLQKLQIRTASLPESLKSAFPDLKSTISDLHNIMIAKDIPLNEKGNKVAKEVGEHIHPVLDEITQVLKKFIGIAVAKEDEADGKENGSVSS